MAEDEKKLTKITFIRATVFDKEPRGEYEVVEVTDATRHAAEVLIRSGKAVAGAVKNPNAAATNKAISATDLDKK